jgi:hypothetical protein
MKFIITEKQSLRLVIETAGVPKSIEFWVNIGSSLVNDTLQILMGSDEKEVFFSGEEVQKKAVSVGWNKNSTSFKEFPLAEPEMSVKIIVVPDGDITKGDDYIDDASFDTSNLQITNSTFDDGSEVMLFVGGLINLEIKIPQSTYDNGTMVDLYSSEISPYIDSVLFHEFTHVYEFYNRILNGTDKPNSEQMWNLVSKAAKVGVDDWDELMFLIYLHLSFEMNARVSEIYGLLRSKKITNKDGFMKELNDSRVWSYANRLKNFDATGFLSDFVVPDSVVDNVRKYDEKDTPIETIKHDVLNDLVSNWSSWYELYLSELSSGDGDKHNDIPKLDPKITSSPEKFLKFWEKRFNRAGEDSIRKISKLYTYVTQDQ